MSGTKSRILLVEDEFMISMLTEELLIELGYDVVACAATLEQGLAAATTQALDLAVLDINLNGVQSYPIADVLLDKGIPFIFASGYANGGVESRFAGAPKLQKPFTMEALDEALAQLRR